MVDSNETMASSEERRISFFLIANPASGGNAAAVFTDVGMNYFELDDPEKCRFWVCDIRNGPSGQKPTFQKMKQVIEETDVAWNAEGVRTRSREPNLVESGEGRRIPPKELVYVIVAGGDGTVMWCLTELQAHGIDDTKLVLGIVPYGTGNDFAHALGWSHFNAIDPFQGRMTMLKRVVSECLEARVVWHDIWDIEVSIEGSGEIKKIDSATRKKKVTCSAAEPMKTKMCNYFSVGVESRIGLGFDRYRTNNQVLNKMRYGLEGTKKSFFKRTTRVEGFLDDIMARNGEATEVFTTRPNDPLKIQNAASLICMNIPSFASGLDLWRKTKKVGLVKSQGNEEQRSFLQAADQVMGDGNLEFVIFSSVTTLGLERMIPGNGKRVAQGQGPFVARFKKLDPNTRIYFQVDGEFFQATSPKEVVISWACRYKVLASKAAPNANSNAFMEVSC